MSEARVSRPPSRSTRTDLNSRPEPAKLPLRNLVVRRESVLQAALVAALVLLATISTIQNRFVSLDDALYLDNKWVGGGLTSAGVIFAFTTVSTLYWHPLAWLSHELDVELFGLNPAGHHFTSLLLHSISAGVLFLVLWRVRGGKW